MAGLTKEQKAQKEAERLAEQEQVALISMVTESERFPGAPQTADVHPDEVENFKADGWRVAE